MLLLVRELIVFVIPGRAAGASPESIIPGGAIVYYVYIVASRKHGTLYLGVTNDLVRRVYEHKTHAVRGFTSRYRVHILVCSSATMTSSMRLLARRNSKSGVANGGST